MEAGHLLAIVQKECNEHGVRFHISSEVNVTTGNIPCSGFFDDQDKVLAIATGKTESSWFPILIHEYMHMQQWIEQCKEWVEMDGADILMDKWIGNEVELTKKEVRKMIDRVQAVELDCERRSVEFIRKHNITQIDIEEYIKKANSYVLYYRMIEGQRRFYDTTKRPYEIEAVWRAMPSDFEGDYAKLTPEIEKLFTEYC